MEKTDIYSVIAEEFSLRTALYPGSADDIAPSLSIPYVAYMDTNPAIADFFRDKNALVQQMSLLKHYVEPCTFDFYAEDYNMPPNLPQFDLLISRYAGNVGQAMKQYLRDGGILLVTEGPEDADLAFHDPDYELIGTICQQNGRYELVAGIVSPEYLSYSSEDADDDPIQYPMQRTFCFRKQTGSYKMGQVTAPVFVCNHCHYLFSCHDRPEQCPDCGKFTVRPATKAEEQDLIERSETERFW